MGAQYWGRLACIQSGQDHSFAAGPPKKVLKYGFTARYEILIVGKRTADSIKKKVNGYCA
jgi:hypothetical protein